MVREYEVLMTAGAGHGHELVAPSLVLSDVAQVLAERHCEQDQNPISLGY